MGKRNKATAAQRVWNHQGLHKRYKPAQDWTNSGELTKGQQNFLLKLGVNYQSVNELEKPENYKCAICQSKQNIVIDHDHESGDFRDLLCSKCNNGLGQFQDNPKLLFTAFLYLRKHNR